VGVAAPREVAALVNWNDVVAVIHAMNEQAPSNGVVHVHDVVRVHERGHAHASGNGDDQGHVHDPISAEGFQTALAGRGWARQQSMGSRKADRPTAD
jgi:hypothetical protein